MNTATSSYLTIPVNEFLALINANSPSATNPFVTVNDLLGSVNIQIVATFSSLPAASVATGQLFFVEQSTGLSWWPAMLGGNYRPAGLYYSNGTNWVTAPMPYQATQPQVDAGTDNETFVTPATLVNAAKWDTKADIKDTEISVKNITELLEIHPANVNNEIQLGNATYRFDAKNFVLTGYTLLGHPDGTTITAYSQNITTIVSTQNNVSLIKTGGNLFIKHVQFSVTGINSRVIEINGITGSEAVDLFYTSFLNCTELGILNSIRQFFWTTGFALNCGKGFLCQGVWTGGIKLSNSRIINVSQYIFKGDSGFSCVNVRSDVYATIPSGSVAFSFDYANFSVDSGYLLEGGYYDGGGLMVAPFTTGGVAAAQNSRRSYFKNNKGVGFRNTYIGFEWICTAEIQTTLVHNVKTRLLGTLTFSNEVHFTHDANNEAVYIPTIPKFITIQDFISLLGGQNDIIEITVEQWDDSASAYIVLQTVTRTIVSSPSGDDIAEFPILCSALMNQNDRIAVFVKNTTDNSPVTMRLSSKSIGLEK